MGLASFTRRIVRGALASLGDGYSSIFSDNSHLEDISLDAFLGSLPNSVRVSRANAMQIGPVANARHAIAGTVGRLPLIAEQGSVRAPQQPALLGQVETGVPLATTLTWTADALFFQPCTWWHVLERDYYGWPVKAEWISLERAGLDNEGRLITVDRKPVKPQDVIRFDSPLGHGFLKNAAKVIQRAIAIDLAASHAEDNPIPVVELHNENGDKMEPKEIEELLDNWSAARRKRGVGYTPKSLKVIAHAGPDSALLIDGRKAIGLETIRHANLPAWAASMAVEGATMTYDNRNLRNWELIDLTLAGYFTAIAGRLSLNDVTPRGTDVRFELDELTRDDLKTRFEAYGLGKKFGFIDNAWIAKQEGWDTVPADTPTKEKAA